MRGSAFCGNRPTASSCLVVEFMLEMRCQCISTGDFELVWAQVVLCSVLIEKSLHFTQHGSAFISYIT